MTKSAGENEDGGNARSKAKSSPRTPKETAEQRKAASVTILECPTCYSQRAVVLDCHPPKARCADCGTVYKIKTEKPLGSLALDDEPPPPKKAKPQYHGAPPDELPPAQPRPTAAGLGPLTEYVTATIKGGPQALRAAQKEANRLAKKFGIDFEAQWLLRTPWLDAWAKGEHGGTNHAQNLLVPKQSGARDTRIRVRAAMSMRARFLSFYAVFGSKIAACRKAKVGHATIEFHLRNDPDFMAQAETAKAYAIDLLHTRAMQRAIEGDCEPVYWQGIEVGHVRKFDSRLQIEMLRAHMPNKFKTPGTGGVNIDTGDKILVMTEELRAKLMALHREAIMDMPTTQEGQQESQS